MSVGRQWGIELPEYPWDGLAPYRKTAQSHPQGIVDLSIGTPVDPTPDVIRKALAYAADAPGYPTTLGTLDVRESISRWFVERRGVPGVDPATEILPTVGSKEMVAWLPFLLGLSDDDVVVYPTIAYPTYAIGAELAKVSSYADDLQWIVDGAEPPSYAGNIKLIWLNSPSNPTGAVLSKDYLRAVVSWAREHGAVVASDECYAELGWENPWDAEPIPSALDPEVTGGSHESVLVLYSLSKQSNLAGYRAAFIAGDNSLIKPLLLSRKHAGMIVPAPVQAAMVAALTDREHVRQTKERYGRRRAALLPAVQHFGMTVHDSVAGLYLWVTGGEDAWSTVGKFAEQGILVGPGVFYGQVSADFVRISLTASDERIESAVSRLYR